MDLTMEVDKIVHNILINATDMYPPAPVAGSTHKMREAIREVDRLG